MSQDIIDPKELWIDSKKTKIEIKNEKAWAKLRVKNDKGEQYIDILAGNKNEDPHIHFGINLDQSIRFIEHRGKIDEMERVVKSRKYGLISNEKCIIKEDPYKSFNLIIQLTVDGSTKEVKIKTFELQPIN